VNYSLTQRRLIDYYNSSMKTIKLPKSVNPVQLAGQNDQIQGHLSLAQFERLGPLLQENTGTVDFSLHFMQDASQRAVVSGTVSAQLKLQCRRCLQPFSYQLEATVSLAVVENDQAAEELPEFYDPLLVVDGEVTLESLIEDELLLNLPVMPGHSEGECPVAIPSSWVDNELDEHKTPFTVLKKLLRSDKDGST
jgi:uncharacterized protein